MSIEGQLIDELSGAVWRLTPVLPQICPFDDEVLRGHIAARSAWIAALLVSDDTDDGERAGTVVDLLHAIWGSADPPPDWWATTLGAACAMSLGSDHVVSWTHSVAAAWLGVTTGTIATLAHRGTIAKHPDGGLVPADVVRYGRERRTVD